MQRTVVEAPAVADDALPKSPPRRAVPWGAVRAVAGVGVLAFLLWRLGSRPFLDRLRMVALVVVRGARFASGRGIGRWRRVMPTVGADARAGLLGPRVLPGVVLELTVAVAGHLVTFVVAACTAGLTAPVGQLLPLTLLA